MSARLSIHLPPCPHRVGNDGLPAPIIDINMAYGLLALFIFQRFDGGAVLGLHLQGQPHVAVGRVEISPMLTAARRAGSTKIE